MNVLLVVSLSLTLWIFMGNVVSLVFMTTFAYVPGVSSFTNWLPTILSVTSSLGFLAYLVWIGLVENQQSRYYLDNVVPKISTMRSLPITTFFCLLILMELSSAIILTILNADGGDEDLSEDDERMMKIWGIVGTSYHWLTTTSMILLMIPHLNN